MPVFAYIARAPNRAATSGVLSADSPRQARDVLRARGLSVERVTPQDPRPRNAERGGGGGDDAGIRPARRPFARRHAAKVVSFIRELSTLLAVGIPLLEAIDTILAQHKGPFRAALLDVRDRVASGVSLAEAMRGQPALFGEMDVSIAEVGENAGNLDVVLERLADFKERAHGLRSRITTALIYPGIVMTMAAGVSVLLMTVVVPNLLAALTDAGRPLPLATRVVKAASEWLVEWWWLLLLLAGAAAALGGALLRTPRGLGAWHRLQLRIPLLGEMVRKGAIVRIAVVMATLLKSGVVFVRAVQIAQRTTANTVLRSALARVESAVTGGRDIGAALAETRAFPPLVAQIFAVGQQSGRLEEMLERLAADYDRQLTTAAARLTAALEPMLILFMVAVVGFIAFATILPMLEAADAF